MLMQHFCVNAKLKLNLLRNMMVHAQMKTILMGFNMKRLLNEFLVPTAIYTGMKDKHRLGPRFSQQFALSKKI